MRLQRVLSKKYAKLLVLPVFLVICGTLGYQYYSTREQKTEITKSDLSEVTEGGYIKSGKNLSDQVTKLTTNSNLVFESREIETQSKTANAAVLKWDQTNPDQQASDEEAEELAGSVVPQMRTYNPDSGWSDWVDSDSGEDRKDNTPVPHTALVLSDSIEKIQYRFVVNAGASSMSPTVDLEKAGIQMIDTSKGPSPTKPKSTVEKLLGAFKLQNQASAGADSPRIYSRAEWGSPEPNGSPRWEPEYRSVVQTIVHHTATARTPDSAAAIRAIWDYHANGHGWGDIGYNYLVDHNGNIFQGRYSNPYDEYLQGGEVVGGHAYGNNYHTTGIAVLGNFTTDQANSQTLEGVARISAFKMHRFEMNPAGTDARGQNTIGHRDVGSTSCPGNNLYGQLQTIRNMANYYYHVYDSQAKYDVWYRGQGVDGQPASGANFYQGSISKAYVDLTNVGNQTWSNTAGTLQTQLGTDRPMNRPSYFYTQSWIDLNRASTFANRVDYTDQGPVLTPDTQIQPGETARFTFDVQAPPGTGEYKEYFHVLNQGQAYFNRNLGIHFIFNSVPHNLSWQYVDQKAYTDATMSTEIPTNDIEPGQRFYTVLRARNSGKQTWDKGGLYPMRLGTSNTEGRSSVFCDPSWIACSRPAGLEETTVKTGEIGTFKFWMKAPNNTTSTNYKEYFRPLAEGMVWINDPGMHWPITVNP